MLCNQCPRQCNIDRSNSIGICGVPDKVKIAKAYLHQWEEPCISGEVGSGTIFFSGCNLKCEYCQNYDISAGAKGKYITIERLAEIFKELENKGAANINLVSPSHYAKQIIAALNIYKPQIPIVYNSNGYDSLETIEHLKDYVDIFLVDFKYIDNNLANRLSHTNNYVEVAKANLLKMREFQPEEVYENNLLKKGVIIRHLVLPNHIDNSKQILKWIKTNITNPTISLMGQYTAMFNASKHNDINRPLKPIEYKIVVGEMLSLGLNNGYIQELSSADQSYTPAWDYEGV